LTGDHPVTTSSSLITDIAVSDTSSDNVDVIVAPNRSKISPFSIENVVYCIRYKELPKHFRIGCVFDRTFVIRLREHVTSTGFKPIVLFAFEQVQKHTEVHPIQFELALQQSVARDLVESGYFESYNLRYIKDCGSYGFEYNGSESDIARICFDKRHSFFSNNFVPLSTGVILAGNMTI